MEKKAVQKTQVFNVIILGRIGQMEWWISERKAR